VTKARKVKDSDVHAETARLAVLASLMIDKARKAAGLSKSELARRLNVPPSRVTRVLEGSANVTLETLARFGLACGVYWTFEPHELRCECGCKNPKGRCDCCKAAEREERLHGPAQP